MLFCDMSQPDYSGLYPNDAFTIDPLCLVARLGQGGHSQEILRRINKKPLLLADPLNLT